MEIGKKKHLFFVCLATVWVFGMANGSAVWGQDAESSGTYSIGRLKYGGGGDWYNDPTAIPNLCHFLKKNTLITIREEEAKVDLGSEQLFEYPILFMTGHGKIVLSQVEIERLRLYLLEGGFLYADDDYGMDAYFRALIKKAFPDREMVELPFSHGIYDIQFDFPNGLPKIHEHDNQPPQGFGIFDSTGRLMVFYTFETNISDGWVDADVYNDPEEKREAALKMGANIVVWALVNHSDLSR
jgi:hypothetical protein